ncbi:AAA family ATPase [Colwelliaceae bacterium 6441]
MVAAKSPMKMPTTFSGEVVIKTIRKVGIAFGGIIFTCRTTCPKNLRFVVKADHQIARLSKLYRVGHTWQVEGDVTEHIVKWNNGESKVEWQINATNLSFKRAAHENLITLLKGVTGVGEDKAKFIAKLGDELYDIARNNDIETLAQHCTKNIAGRIITELRDYEALGAVQLLDECGVPVHISERALNIWDIDTFDKISTNPYFLIPFEADLKLIDAFAINRFSFKHDAPERLEAYVKGALFDGFSNGNTCLKEIQLKTKLKKQLGTKQLAEKALTHAYSNGTAIKVGDLVQVGSMHIIESTIAENILKLKSKQLPKIPQMQFDYFITQYEQSVGFDLTVEQRNAVLMACNSPIMLLTGGAGCGKTTVIEAICFVLEQSRIASQIILMALAGKAAQRITETTKREAMTIAGFLFHVDSTKIEEHSVIVIDESSMVDTLSLNRILKKIPKTGRIIFAGDYEQLPPVGVGLTLHNMVKMDLPKTHLSVPKRFSEASGIPMIANKIRNFPDDRCEMQFTEFNGAGNGVSFIEAEESNIQEIVISIYEKLGGNGNSEDIVILSPMRTTSSGVLEINNAHHLKFFDTTKDKLLFQDDEFNHLGANINNCPVCMGELLMSKRNDYQRGIRNGSVGKVTGFERNKHIITVDFNGNFVNFHISEMPYLERASAMTVHKSQGSQYKRVIVIVKDCHMLDRNLLYTAITRATEQVIFVGSKNVFYQKLLISKTSERLTLMQYYFEQ